MAATSGDTSARSGSTAPVLSIPDGGFPSVAVDAEASAEAKCENPLAYIRDFRGCKDTQGDQEPDFEYLMRDDRGIVTDTLGSDGKPVYAHGDDFSTNKTVHSKTTFDHWYNDNSGISVRFEVTLPLTPDPNDPTIMVYDNSNFFPIDGQGWGNQPCQGGRHNYSFTTEIHTKFTYKGGEKFTFKGDDDVFVYVNNHLVMDLGGVHTQEIGVVDFDPQASQIGIAVGGTYPMDIFHAERHTSQSNFHMEVRNICLQVVKIP